MNSFLTHLFLIPAIVLNSRACMTMARALMHGLIYTYTMPPSLKNSFYTIHQSKRHIHMSRASPVAGITHASGISINLVSPGKKFISLPWDSAGKFWRKCVSANQNAPCRTFVPVNGARSGNLRQMANFIPLH